MVKMNLKNKKLWVIGGTLLGALVIILIVGLCNLGVWIKAGLLILGILLAGTAWLVPMPKEEKLPEKEVPEVKTPEPTVEAKPKKRRGRPRKKKVEQK